MMYFSLDGMLKEIDEYQLSFSSAWRDVKKKYSVADCTAYPMKYTIKSVI